MIHHPSSSIIHHQPKHDSEGRRLFAQPDQHFYALALETTIVLEKLPYSPIRFPHILEKLDASESFSEPLSEPFSESSSESLSVSRRES